MKRVTAIIIIAAICISLAACRKKPVQDDAAALDFDVPATAAERQTETEQDPETKTEAEETAAPAPAPAPKAAAPEIKPQYVSVPEPEKKPETAEWTVDFDPEMIASVSAEPVYNVEDIDYGPYNAILYDNMPEEEFAKLLRYNDVPPLITVTSKDGKTMTAGIETVKAAFGCSVEYSSPQVRGEKWPVGEYEGKLAIRRSGRTYAECKYPIFVEQNPLDSFTVDDIVLIDGIDSQRHIFSPSVDAFTATMKDGSVQRCEGYLCSLKYRGRQYGCVLKYTAEQYKSWTVGEYTLEATLMGKTAPVRMRIIPNPYSGVEISGGSDLILTFTRKDGGVEKHTVTDVPQRFNEGFASSTCVVVTDKRIFRRVTFNWDVYKKYQSSLSVTFDDFQSNRRSDIKYFRALYMKSTYLYAAYAAHEYFGFRGFDGAVTKDNIEGLCLFVRSSIDGVFGTRETDSRGEPLFDDGVPLYKVPNNVYSKQEPLFEIAAKKALAVDSFDLTLHPRYWRDNSEWAPTWNGGTREDGFFTKLPVLWENPVMDSDISYSDGKWTIICKYVKNKVLYAVITLDEELRITKIEYKNTL